MLKKDDFNETQFVQSDTSSEEETEYDNVRKLVRFAIVLFIIFICFLFFTIVSFFKSNDISKQIKPINIKSDIAIRGNIYSLDNYIFSSSEKFYSISISPAFIDPNKQELFINLFSIYSNVPKSVIKDAIGNRTSMYKKISNSMPEWIAANLIQLNSKLLKIGVFRDIQDNNGNTLLKRGIDISEIRINRSYPLGETLEPILGYIREQNGKIKRIDGMKGIEKYRNDILSPKRDGKVSGAYDANKYIILNGDSQIINREDGFDIRLTIPLSLQIKIEKMLKDSNRQYKANEIIAAVINPLNGEILSFASSKTYNPNIGKRGGNEVLDKMNISAIERMYEPGSTIKPLIFSYMIDRNLINKKKELELGDGILKLRSYVIRDTHPLKKATPEEILIKSSNIGMVKLTSTLSGAQMQKIFKDFLLGTPTNIDLAYEKNGFIPSINILNREVEKATASYGYGLEVTFLQLLRSYAAFNNGGKLIYPHVTKNFISPSNEIFVPKFDEPIQIISEQTSKYMEKMLHRIVKEGTGGRADVHGLIVGGKTGTAHIARKGQYQDLYNGSFFGYASDGVNTYTIGVIAFMSNSDDDYYGGKTAAPIFSKIANLLIEEGFLNLNYSDKVK